MAIKKLAPEQLRRSFSAKALPFKTTDDISPLEGIIGQERALKALELGLEIDSNGYNIFATGTAGTGRTTIIKKILKDYARKQKAPDDWCYVYNFSDPDSPKALSLPAGKGREFQNDMAAFVETLWREIKRAFSGEHYEQQKTAIINRVNQEKRQLLKKLDEKAAELNLKIQPTSMGFQTIPLKDGEPITQEMFQELPGDEQEKLQGNVANIEGEITETIRQLARLDFQVRKLLNQLDEDVTRFVVEQYVNELKADYKKFPQILEYLDAVSKDIVSNTAGFFEPGGQEENNGREFSPEALFRRYRVNVVVDNGHLKGAPVIHETHPTYNNLIGRIEKYPVQGGGYATDFTMIKAGSLLKANGGYLLTDAEEVLRNPYVYESLKRSLRNRCLRVEDVTELYGTISIVSLKPQPIPLKLKVIMIGWNRIYQMLNAYDDDFMRIFKVRADFDERTESKGKVALQYARFVKRIIDDEQLRAFDREAIEEIIQYGHRLAGDQGKISLEFGQIIKIVQQAAFWSAKENSKAVGKDHVRKAIVEYENRHGRLRENVQESILQDIRKIVVKGEHVGEINALSVYQAGGFSFGTPSRITAKTFIGNDAINTIERKVGLSGKIHDKGSYILSGFFNAIFGDYNPVNFSASIAFEQSYGRIDGDSASSTELYALLSSLADAPIKQGIAVTGSVNQNGEVQAIGGVNEKIEGFFDICNEKGLTGEQGVMIPRSNAKDLMLKPEVIAAVSAKKFNIWTVETIDDGVKLLMGMRTGTRNIKGHFAKNTLYYKVEQKLRELNVRSEVYRTEINEEQKKRTGKDKVKSAKNNDRKKPDKNSTPSNGENSSDEDKSKG